MHNVGVEEGRVAEADWAEGGEERIHHGGEVGLLGLGDLLERKVVEDALSPFGGREDDVDGAADVGIELLEVVGGRACVLDEVVEFEDHFVAAGKAAKTHDLAEVADGAFGSFH